MYKKALFFLKKYSYLKYLTLIFFAFTFYLLFRSLFSFHPDFNVYYHSSKGVFNGTNPYLGDKGTFGLFLYPPFALLLFLPLTLFSFFWAQILWTILSILSLILSTYLILKTYKQKFFSYTGLVLLSLTFIYFPVRFTLGMGQLNLFLLLLLSIFIYFYHKKKNLLSSFFLGISIMLKLFPMIVLAYLIIRKKWKILFYLFLVTLIGTLITSILIKPDLNFYYFKNVLPDLAQSWKVDYYNQALSGVIIRFIKDRYLSLILKLIISLALLAFSLFAIYKKRKENVFVINLEIGLLLVLILLINDFSWQHHFALLLLPLLTTFFYIKNNMLDFKYYFVLGFSYFLTAINLKDPGGFPLIFQSHVFFGALLLWFLNMHFLLKKN